MADYTTPADESMFAAIGRHSISWAFIEAGVEYMVITIHSYAGGDSVEPEMPWSLDRKLRYLKKCFRRLGPLKPFTDEAIAILTEIGEASDTRHDLTHGIVTEHIEGSDAIKMLRLLRRKTERYGKEISMTTTEILKSANNANDLGGRTLGLSTKLMDVFIPEDRN